MDKLLQIIARLKRHLGMSVSAFMHIFLLILLLINFPQCQRKNPQEIIIAVDLLPIAKVSNVENKQVEKPKIEEKPAEKPKPVEEVKPVLAPEPKPEIKPEPKPEPKKLDPKKEVVKKPEPKDSPKPKPDPKKNEKKKKKPILSEYEKLLKDLQEIEKKNDIQEDVADKRSKGPHNSDIPLSLSVKDSIRRQIEQCWNPPAGNKDAAQLQILLRISFKLDGSVAKVKVIDNNKYNSDELYKVAADAAVRAVHKASPLQGLPADQYNIWQDLEFNFNPSGILGD
jgi:outer membrane biosynthesis protein TonB